MELFAKIFSQKASSYMFDMVLNTPPDLEPQVLELPVQVELSAISGKFL